MFYTSWILSSVLSYSRSVLVAGDQGESGLVKKMVESDCVGGDKTLKDMLPAFPLMRGVIRREGGASLPPLCGRTSGQGSWGGQRCFSINMVFLTKCSSSGLDSLVRE